MYRLSTTNYLVIRMGCGNGDTVGRKWGNGKGLREGWGLEKIVEICRRVKTVLLKPEGTAPCPTIWSLNCACFTPSPESTSPVTAAGSNGRCNTIWYEAVFKGGVYETRETVWAFGGAETRRVASLEGR